METMPIMLVGLYVFILATLAGKEVITKVPPTLHTPLMSGANAISGIAILGLVAIIFATVNVVGGFMVTDRMLEMFKKK